MHALYSSIPSQDSNASGCAYTSPNNAATTLAIRATSPDRTRNKCATVTMMLAERIIRNDWSVEDEHFFESNHMNVWQTLEFLSGISLRRRYNYEGYSDTNNSIRTLTPSWRRDSFVEKNVNPNVDESSASNKNSSSPSSSQGNEKYAVASGNVNAPTTRGGSAANRAPRLASAGAGGAKRLPSGQAMRPKSSIPKKKETKTVKSGATSAYRRRRSKKKLRAKELDPEYALSPSDYSDLIKCTSKNETTIDLFDGKYGRPVFRAIMSKKTFEYVNQVIRFDDAIGNLPARRNTIETFV